MQCDSNRIVFFYESGLFRCIGGSYRMRQSFYESGLFRCISSFEVQNSDKFGFELEVINWLLLVLIEHGKSHLPDFVTRLNTILLLHTQSGREATSSPSFQKGFICHNQNLFTSMLPMLPQPVSCRAAAPPYADQLGKKANPPRWGPGKPSSTQRPRKGRPHSS